MNHIRCSPYNNSSNSYYSSDALAGAAIVAPTLVGPPATPPSKSAADANPAAPADPAAPSEAILNRLPAKHEVHHMETYNLNNR